MQTHLLLIYRCGISGNPTAVLNTAIRILRSFLTHSTRWINHYQCSGIANAANNIINKSSDDFAFYRAVQQGKFVGSTAANIKSDFSSSFIPYWYDYINTILGAVYSKLPTCPQLWKKKKWQIRDSIHLYMLKKFAYRIVVLMICTGR